MAGPLRILFLAAECAPFYAVGTLADWINGLPRALRERGHDVRVALPRYTSIDGARFGLSPVGGPFTAYAGREPRRTEVLRSDATGVPTLFVWDERFFNRPTVYGQPDEGMAFAFFVRAVLEFLRAGDWIPDVIHAHEWHAALAPTWLDVIGRRDPRFAGVASIYTIHSLAYQGVTGDAIWTFAGLPDRHRRLACEPPGRINWMARGIAHADAVTTLSPRYARQITQPASGAGLDGLLRERRDRLSGILGGLDDAVWNPSSDPALAARFAASSLDGRARNKRALQTALQLSRRDAPLMGMATRLSDPAGFDLLLPAMEDVLARGVQFALIGSGEPHYESAFRVLAARHSRQVAYVPRSDGDLVRLLYGGSDAVLIPSREEPGGQAAMIAMRYGSVPVAHASGALADIIVDATRRRSTGTGFTFGPHTRRSLLGAIDRMLKAYRAPRVWRAVQGRAMSVDSSWARAAPQYERVYRTAVQRRRTA